MADYKLDIKRVMENLDYGNRGFYATLSEEEKKSFTPLTVMRWASSVSSDISVQEHYITYINDLVNIHFWELSKHPELQWILMSMVGFGQKQYHSWIPMSKKAKSATTLVDKLLSNAYPSANNTELEIMRKMNTVDEFVEYAKDLAWSDKEIKALKQELKKNGNA